jgi:hypothetical protein
MNDLYMDEGTTRRVASTFYEEISINGHTLLVHETEQTCIIIENDIENEEQNHVYVFDTEGLIECFSKDEQNLDEFFDSLLQIGYMTYKGVNYPVWFPNRYRTIYKLQHMLST